MFDYYDETYDDYGDQSELEYSYPQPFQTPPWQPRDAVLAWQTTPDSPDTLYPDRRRG